MRTIFTIPPYAPFIKDLMRNRTVVGARLNTVMPLKGSLEDELTRMKDLVYPKKLWLDLKCRQVRVTRGYYFNAPKDPITFKQGGKTVVLDPSNPRVKGSVVTPPWNMIEVDHNMKLDTTKPRHCYFNDGLDSAYVAKIVDGNKLIMLDGPKKIVGSGESINIMHPSLEIEGYLTDLDKQYIETAKNIGNHNYMLSYVEKESDITDLLDLDPRANIVAKIESEKGLEFVANHYSNYKDNVRLMAARGDLYVEVNRPHKILSALKQIIEADPNAIAASRILGGLRNSAVPSCADICDLGFLTEVGYQTVMVGDDICFDKDAAYSAINIVEAVSNDYSPRTDHAKNLKTG
jgi:pyruvate kinase